MWKYIKQEYRERERVRMKLRAECLPERSWFKPKHWNRVDDRGGGRDGGKTEWNLRDLQGTIDHTNTHVATAEMQKAAQEH